MKKFKIGDVVRLKTDSPERLRLIVRSIDSDRLECTSECERRRVISHGDDFELVERPDPQADMKQAIREVLLSDEFMTAFAAAFFSATVPRPTLEHPILGVNRPMRNEAQLSKMVEMVRQSLTTEPNSSEIPNSCKETPTPNSSHLGQIIEVRNYEDANWQRAELEAVFPHTEFAYVARVEKNTRDFPTNWRYGRLVQADCNNPEISNEFSELVAIAMQMACEEFGRGDGVFNSANFEHACRQIVGSSCSIDGHVIAFILDGRKDVEALKGGRHYRYLEYASRNYSAQEQQSHPPKILDGSSKPTPKPSKTQPPSDYRMLGSAKDEPRQASDLYWSLSAKNWNPIKPKQVEYANRDDWVACRKIEVTSPPPKRYRKPTLADLANKPIACEYRDSDEEQWKSGLLVYVLDGDQPFLCVNKERNIAIQWKQCQTEVTGDS